MRVAIKSLLIIILAVSLAAEAAPLAAPGDMRLRHDLQLLNDSGVINLPLTAWPVALGDIHGALGNADRSKLSGTTKAAYDRVREHLAGKLDGDGWLAGSMVGAGQGRQFDFVDER